MRRLRLIQDSLWPLGLGAVAFAAITSVASAGGFDIHEQSTVFLGSTSAGVAAGGSIGSMYWNPAATAQFSGLNTESSYTLVLPSADVTVTGISPGLPVIPPGTPGSTSGDVGIDAVTSAGYGTYQVSRDLWVGMGINSPFGLATKPDNTDYFGRVLGVTTKLITVNANPTIAYKIAPGITVGAGIQIEWARAKLQFGTGLSPAPIAQFKGTDWAVGATAGILLEPAAGTSIGLGYRSGLSHEFKGRLTATGLGANADGFVELPELVTLSIRQAVTPVTRLMGTVEWTNWSRFDKLSLKSLGLVPVIGGDALDVPANWSDGWFFSVGGEYDYSPVLTLRAGVAYELSPEDDATKRFPTIPDNNRVWASIGASYKYSEATTLDVGYSHIFVQDGAFERGTVLDPSVVVSGTIENASADLISVGMRTRW